MSDKIIKHNIFVYNADGIPIDVTQYVRNWTTSNGGVGEGNTGLDGVVQTGQLTLHNDLDTNFNPESEYGVVITEERTYIGDGGKTYAGVPDDILLRSVGFRRIYGGTASSFSDFSAFSDFTAWDDTQGTTDNSSLYGDVKISGSNFITPYDMPVGTQFTLVYTYIDYSIRNPINTVDDEWSPLLDENSKIEIYALTEDIKWMSYTWEADGTNSLSNPTPGTPLIKGIGIWQTGTFGSWDDTTTFAEWETFEQYDTNYDFYTQAFYNQEDDTIVLGNTPTSGKKIVFSISYYEGTPEMIFSGYLGDSILVSPDNKTIDLSFRDKGKKLQDTVIDGVTNVLNIENWGINSTTDSEIVTIEQVDSTTGIFTSTAAHGFVTGDTIAFSGVLDSLPLQSSGDRLTGTYTVTRLSDTTFSLDGINFEGKSTTVDIQVMGSTEINPARGSSYNVTVSFTTEATLNLVNDTLTFDYDDLKFARNFRDISVGTNITFNSISLANIIYINDSALVYVEGGSNKLLKKDGYFYLAGINGNKTISRGDTVVIDTKNFEDVKTTAGVNARLKADYEERGTQIDSINVSTNVFTSSTDNTLEDGDIVSISSTGTLPEDASGTLSKLYEVGVIDDTTFKLYTRTDLGELEEVDVTSAGTGTINIISTQLEVVDVINNIIKDLDTIEIKNVVADIEEGFSRSVAINTDLWDKKTVWDTLQTLASMKALYIAYIWNETAQDFELTIRNIRDKTSADFTLESNEIYTQTQNITGKNIRNTIYVNYYNSAGTTSNRESVVATDETSIARYGARPSIITEANTSPINNPTIAQNFADAVLEASKDRVIESNAIIPFTYKFSTTRLDVGLALGLTYKYLDSTGNTVPFYIVESIEHTYNNGRYQTILRGNKQKVRTSVRRYKQIETRPGAFKQQGGRDVSELYQIPAPTELGIRESGLEAVALTPRAYAVLEWRRPDNYYPAHYILEVAKSGDDYSDGRQYKVEANTVFVSQRVELEPGEAYKWRVSPWSRANVKGVVTDDQTIASIGDDDAPSTPTGLSVVGLDEGLQVSFDPNTENDLLGYRIYVRKDNDPTTTTFGKKKVTNSTITVISGLEPGTYHVGVTAFDTSGNESSISSIVEEKNSPAFIIRRQGDMDNWEDTLSSVVVTNPACPEMEYEKVIIYNKGSAYTMNFSDKNIKKANFQIIGVGDPEIECDTGLRIKVDNFMLTGCRFYFNNDSGYNIFLTYYQYSTNNSKLTIKDNIFENDDNGSLGGFKILDVLSNLNNCKIDVGENIFLNQDDTGASLVMGLNSSDTDTKINIYNNKFKSAVEFTAISFLGIVQNFNIRDNYFENGHIDNFISGGATNGSVSENTFYNDVDFATKYYISGQHFNECSYQGNTINNQYSGASGYYLIEGGPRYSTIIGNIANGTTTGFLTDWSTSSGTGTITANNTKNT